MAVSKLDYPIFSGHDALSQLSSWLKENAKDAQIVLLVDENTLRHCVPLMLEQVPELEGVEFLEIESGEEQKNIEIATQLWFALTELNLNRNDIVINVGGGVLGDMGGFVASAYKRGVRFVQVPTTLLAMVDASVGGKVGIDLGELKNQIGFFAKPEVVVAYTPFLESLDVAQVKSGYAEMIKHGLIADADYYKTFQAFDLHVSDKDVERSIEIKADIVAKDFKEGGLRKLLNFGHTFGHALESYFLAQHKPVLHGEAVAAGMVCEVLFSQQKLGLKANEAKEICDFLLAHYPKFSINEEELPHLIALMKHDKKNDGSGIKLVGLKAIGEGVFDISISEEEALDVFRSYMAY